MRLRKHIILLFVLINSVFYAYGNECKVNQDSVQAAFSELLKLYGNGDYYEAIDYVNKQKSIIDKGKPFWKKQIYLYKYKSQWEIRETAIERYIENDFEATINILSPIIVEIQDSIANNICNPNSCKVWSSCMWLFGKANEKLSNYNVAHVFLEQNHLFAKNNLNTFLNAKDSYYSYTITDYTSYWSDLALSYRLSGDFDRSVDLTLQLLDYCETNNRSYILSALEDVAYSYNEYEEVDKKKLAASFFIKAMDYMIKESIVHENLKRYFRSFTMASNILVTISDWNSVIDINKKYNLGFSLDNQKEVCDDLIQIIDANILAYSALNFSIPGSLEESIEENKGILLFYERKGETYSSQYAIRLNKMANLYKKKNVNIANDYFIQALDVWDKFLLKRNNLNYYLLLDDYMFFVANNVVESGVRDIESEVEEYLTDLSSIELSYQILLYNSQANYFGLVKNDYVKAEQLISKALILCINNLKSNLDLLSLYVSVLSDAANIQMNLGNWNKADTYSNELLDLLKKYEINDATKAGSLLNLAVNYAYIGNNAKSKELRKEAYTIYLNNGYLYDANGSLNLELAKSILSMFSSVDKIAKCKEFIEICNKEKRSFDLGVCELYTNYASSLSDETMYEDADSVFTLIDDSLNLYKDSLFEDYPNQYKYTISNLYKEKALHEFRKGDYLKSAQYNEISDSISPSYMRNIDLATTYSYANDQKKFDYNILKAIDGIRSLINDNFSFLSDEERSVFINNRTNNFQNWGEFAYLMPNSTIGLQCVYDASLLYKGILLNTNREIQKIILSSDDNNVHELYWELTTAKRRALLNNNDADLEDVRIIEKRLMNLLNIKNGYNDLNLTWKDVQLHLKVGECAIEFMKFDKNYWMLNNDSAKIDNHYVALVITQDSESPFFIDLFDESFLSKALGLGSNLYRTEYGYDLAKIIWGQIEAKLHDVGIIYFSPIGLLNLINIEALGNSDIKYIRLSSTREICKNDNVNFIDAAFYGGLVYASEDINQYDTQKEQLTLSNDKWYSMTDTLTRSNYGYLPGTLEEIVYSDKILRSNGLQTSCYSGQQGNIDCFRQLSGKSPSILHIATHALWDNENLITGLLLHGGLLFSTSKDLDETPLLHRENFMSAFEIATMDLTNTSLAVLSACETGIGKITDDGVFGIQRAFKLAGVKTIIMSLWKVDDVATTLMMTTFYDELFKTGSKYDAFRKAQQIVREEFENPFYWAGFIMLD